jgi:integrase
MLYTGLRISDARKVGQSLEKTIDWRGTQVHCLVFDVSKGAKKRAREGKTKLRAIVPIVPQFAEALNRAPDISPTYLLNEHGNRWKSAKSLDRRMRRWLDAIVDEDGSQPFKDLSSHGLRYTAANWWAKTYRCTPHELMAIFGWLKIEQAMKYTQRYDREDAAAGVVVRFPAGRS